MVVFSFSFLFLVLISWGVGVVGDTDNTIPFEKRTSTAGSQLSPSKRVAFCRTTSLVCPLMAFHLGFSRDVDEVGRGC